MKPSDLRDWREARGLTQRAFAALIGRRPQTISLWESGKFGLPPYLELVLAGLELRCGLRIDERSLTALVSKARVLNYSTVEGSHGESIRSGQEAETEAGEQAAHLHPDAAPRAHAGNGRGEAPGHEHAEGPASLSEDEGQGQGIAAADFAAEYDDLGAAALGKAEQDQQLEVGYQRTAGALVFTITIPIRFIRGAVDGH